ncbi:hypothetical protein DIPPA_07220 [Diplonema papillatum]|nr:hypothetical protein DIPPA_07220 [Diplonema papillatum]
MNGAFRRYLPFIVIGVILTGRVIMEYGMEPATVSRPAHNVEEPAQPLRQVAPVLSVSAPSTSSAPPATPVPTVAVRGKKPVKPLCSSMAHFLAGQVHGDNWNPTNCRIDPVVKFWDCIRKKHVLYIGDSLARIVFDQMVIALKARPGTEAWNSSHPRLEGCMHVKTDTTRQCAVLSNSTYDKLTGGSQRFIWSPVVTAEQSRVITSSFGAESIGRADYVIFSTGMWEMGLKGIPLGQFIPWAITKVDLLKQWMKPGATLVVFPFHWIHLDPRLKQAHTREGCNSGGKLALYRKALIEIAVCAGVEVFDSSQLTKPMVAALKQDGVHYAGRLEGQLMTNSMCRTEEPFPWPTPRDVKCTLPQNTSWYIEEFARQKLVVGCLNYTAFQRVV